MSPDPVFISKDLVYVPGAVHVDLYDRVDLISFDKLAPFFSENLR